MPVRRLRPAEFDAGLRAEPLFLSDGNTRARHVVAAGLEARANELRKAGRPDIAHRLDQLEIRVRDGGSLITKALLGDLKKEIAVVRLALVGTREEDEDDEYEVGKVG